MLNWLRYFPLALPFCRKDSEYIIPHGPLFPKLRKQQWYIGKSSFHFSAPWANSVYGSEQLSRYSDSRSPGKQDVLTYELQPISSDVIPNGRWKGSLIYSREWYFVGPWFSGDYGDLRMAAVIYGEPHLDDLKGASFLHLRVFVRACHLPPNTVNRSGLLSRRTWVNQLALFLQRHRKKE